MLLTYEYIYLGSTIADQIYIPQDEIQAIPLSDMDNASYVQGNEPTFTGTINCWQQKMKAYLRLLAAAVAADALSNGNQSPNRVPFLLTLKTDQPCSAGCNEIQPQRDRLYVVRDTQGRPWIYPSPPLYTPVQYPLLINEAFTSLGGSFTPAPSGIWSTNILTRFGLDEMQGVLDTYTTSPFSTSLFLQRYYASEFSAPGGLFPVSFPGLPSNTVPLFIQSPYVPSVSTQGCANYIAQLIWLDGIHMPSVNGDGGPPSNPANPICR